MWNVCEATCNRKLWDRIQVLFSLSYRSFSGSVRGSRRKPWFWERMKRWKRACGDALFMIRAADEAWDERHDGRCHTRVFSPNLTQTLNSPLGTDLFLNIIRLFRHQARSLNASDEIQGFYCLFLNRTKQEQIQKHLRVLSETQEEHQEVKVQDWDWGQISRSS